MSTSCSQIRSNALNKKYMCLIFLLWICVCGLTRCNRFGNVTGISLIVGFALGLPPLVAQAYGAENYLRCGELLQRQLLIHVTVVLPLGEKDFGADLLTDTRALII